MKAERRLNYISAEVDAAQDLAVAMPIFRQTLNVKVLHV